MTAKKMTVIRLSIPKSVKRCLNCKGRLWRYAISEMLITFDFCEKCRIHYDTV